MSDQFYIKHSADFSKSRFRIWPRVKEFLDSLPSNSTVLDIGCGNGKNMLYRKDLEITGLEYSNTLCEICTNRGLNVVQGDARRLPFKNNSFNAIIMIAVIHHIDPIEQDIVLKEIRRVLQPGGTVLMTNWAVEQPETSKRSFTPGLNWVTWKGKEDTPLPYWILDKDMADEFSNLVLNGLDLTGIEWDAGNWNFYFTKSIKY